MPYSSPSDLPDRVKNNLSKHSQEIFVNAFNSAYDDHKGEDDREETAYKIAWSAAKKNEDKNS